MGFNEGVLVALKDSHAPKHPELPDVPRLCQGAVRLAALLLVPDQRGYPVLEGLPPPAPRDCSLYPEEAPETGEQGQAPGWSPILRRQEARREVGIQEGTRCRRQGGSRRSGIVSARIQRRIRTWWTRPISKSFHSYYG